LGTVRFRERARSLAFSPDGKTLAVAAVKNLLLMDAKSGRRLRLFEGHREWANVLTYSPDGTRLAAGGKDKAVRVWDVHTGKQLVHLAGHQDQIFSLAYSPDGKKLASSGWDGETIVWDLETGKPLHRVPVPKQSINGVAFSPDGRLFVAGGLDGLIRLYEVDGWKARAPMQARGAFVKCLVFCDGGAKLLSAGADGTARLWDIASGKETRHFGGDEGFIRTVAISPDGKTFTGGCQDSVLVVWEFATGETRRRTQLGGRAAVDSISYSPDGRVLAAAGEYMICLWDPDDGKHLNASEESSGSVECLAFSPDGKRLTVAGYPDAVLRLYDVGTGKLLRRLEGDVGSWSSVAFSPDGKLLAGADGPQAAPRLWETAGWKELPPLPKQESWVQDLKFLSNSNELAFCSFPNLLMYEVASGKELFRIGSRQRPVFGATAFLGVRFLATANGLDGVSLWDRSTGRFLRRMVEKRWCRGVSLSPDGKVVAVSETLNSGDEGIALWETATGAERLWLRGQRKVVISPLAREIATIDEDGKCHVWDVFSGQELASPQGHVGRVTCLAFSPDGKTLATGSLDTTVLLWDLGKIVKRPARNRAPFSPKELAALWESMASADAAKAYRAIGELVEAAGEVEPFLKPALAKSPTPSAKEIGQMIVELDRLPAAAREKAAEDIARLGKRALPVIQKAMRANSSAEKGRRLATLFEEASKSEANLAQVRFLRAMEVLEHRATAPARQILRSIAEGDFEDLLTDEARASLDRLKEKPVGR
jgi:WD40 repeat protein